jgi:hypothetical protein
MGLGRRACAVQAGAMQAGVLGPWTVGDASRRAPGYGCSAYQEASSGRAQKRSRSESTYVAAGKLWACRSAETASANRPACIIHHHARKTNRMYLMRCPGWSQFWASARLLKAPLITSYSSWDYAAGPYDRERERYERPHADDRYGPPPPRGERYGAPPPREYGFHDDDYHGPPRRWA